MVEAEAQAVEAGTDAGHAATAAELLERAAEAGHGRLVALVGVGLVEGPGVGEVGVLDLELLRGLEPLLGGGRLAALEVAEGPLDLALPLDLEVLRLDSPIDVVDLAALLGDRQVVRIIVVHLDLEGLGETEDGRGWFDDLRLELVLAA